MNSPKKKYRGKRAQEETDIQRIMNIMSMTLNGQKNVWFRFEEKLWSHEM